MLSKEEAQAILQLISRVSVNGSEVESVVYLKNKLKEIAEKPNTDGLDVKKESNKK